MTQAQYQAVQDGGRIGLMMSPQYPAGTIFRGNVSQVGEGPLTLIGNDTANPLTVDTTPPFIFTHGVPWLYYPTGAGLTPFFGGNQFDVQWAFTIPGDISIRQYLNAADNSTGVTAVNQRTYWASVRPTPAANLPTDTDPVLYRSFSPDMAVGASSLNYMRGLFAAIEVRFPGSSLSGNMDFCIDWTADCNSTDAQEWEVDFSGGISPEGIYSGTTSSSGYDSYINEGSAEIDGEIYGVFTGPNAEAFAGAFNLASIQEVMEGGYADFMPARVDGLFLLERENRLTFAELETIEYDSFLVQDGYGANRSGWGAWPYLDSGSLFIDKTNQHVFRPSQSQSVEATFTSTAEESYYFPVTLQRWEGPLLQLKHNLQTGQVADECVDTLYCHDQIDDLQSQVAFYSAFERSTSNYANNLWGRFNHVMMYMGETNGGEPLLDDNVEMSFDIDFTTSQISKGRLFLPIYSETQDYNWQVFFNGSINLARNELNFLILESDPLDTTATTRLQYGTTVGSFSNFEGSLKGALVARHDDTYEYEIGYEGGYSSEGNLGVVASFFFKDRGETTRSVSGQLLVEGWIENRLTIEEAFSLDIPGFVLPSGTDEVFAAFTGPGIPTLFAEVGEDGEGGFDTHFSAHHRPPV